jgi:ATP-binding cassette subfamily B protein
VSRLWPFFRRFLRYRWTLLAGFLTIPLGSLCDIWLTLVVGDGLNRLRAGDDTAFLRGLFVSLIAIAFVRGLFRFLQRWLVVGVSRRVEQDLKQDLFDKLTRLPFAFHNRSKSGDVVSRVTSDVENIRMFLGPGLMYVAGAITLVPASGFVLVRLAPGLAAWMLVPIAVMVLGMRVLVPRLHRVSNAVQESLAEISHVAQESFAGIRVVKGYGVAAQRSARFERVSAESRDHQIALARVRGVTNAITHSAFDMTFLPILFVGGMAMIDRTLAAGDLFKFMDLTLKVFWPVISLGWMAGMYPRALVSAERIDALLHEPETIGEPAAPRRMADVRGDLELERVRFTYPGSARPALRDVTVRVPAGTTLGVVGPTGSGKTTLLNLLGRMFDAEGRILLDGAPIRDLPLATLRGAIGYVPQDSFLFSETWRENVAFGSTSGELDDDELADLAERAAVADDLADFPDGFDQMIGERGVTLSGGQRQRTCIARALAKDPPILVFDDCLSAVDTETEARLIRSLHHEGRGRTMVIAAHRLTTVRGADNVLVLKDGRIEAQGTHAELLQISPWYRDTWERQRAREELEDLS